MGTRPVTKVDGRGRRSWIFWGHENRRTHSHGRKRVENQVTRKEERRGERKKGLVLKSGKKGQPVRQEDRGGQTAEPNGNKR